MVNQTYIPCHVQAYDIKLKKKTLHSYESAGDIYYILKDISEKTYDARESINNKRQSINGHDFAMDFPSFPQDKNTTLTRVDFNFGREVYESLPLKKKDGTKSTLDLPPDSNICFDTHGSFLFKIVDGEWRCILLLERRFHTAGFGKIVEYIQKFKPSYKIEEDPITTETNYIRKINAVRDLKAIIIRNREFKLQTEEGAGTFFAKTRENRGDEVSRIQVTLKEGSSNYERFIDFFKRHKFVGGRVTNAQLRNLIDENGLVLVRTVKSGSKEPRFVPLVDDFILYTISVSYESQSRKIDDNDFFDKLFFEVSEAKIIRLFKLSGELNNHTQEE